MKRREVDINCTLGSYKEKRSYTLVYTLTKVLTVNVGGDDEKDIKDTIEEFVNDGHCLEADTEAREEYSLTPIKEEQHV